MQTIILTIFCLLLALYFLIKAIGDIRKLHRIFKEIDVEIEDENALIERLKHFDNGVDKKDTLTQGPCGMIVLPK